MIAYSHIACDCHYTDTALKNSIITKQSTNKLIATMTSLSQQDLTNKQ